MDKNIKTIYKSGCENKQFLKEIEEADGDKEPRWFANELERHLFATMYYGWLVGKYGNDWKQYIQLNKN